MDARAVSRIGPLQLPNHQVLQRSPEPKNAKRAIPHPKTASGNDRPIPTLSAAQQELTIHKAY